MLCGESFTLNLLPLITLLHQFAVGLSCWWAYGGTLRVKITISVFHRACLRESSWTQRQSDYRMISTDVMSDFRKTRAESCIRLLNVSLRIADLKYHFNLEIKGNWNKVLAFIECKMHFGSFSKHDPNLRLKLSNAVSWCSLPQKQSAFNGW